MLRRRDILWLSVMKSFVKIEQLDLKLVGWTPKLYDILKNPRSFFRDLKYPEIN